MKKPSLFSRNALGTLVVVLMVFVSFYSCKNEELPVTIRGKVKHAITNEPIEGIVVEAKSIICSGFKPTVCTHVNETRNTDEKGDFAISYFQDCETEIEVSLQNQLNDDLHKRFALKEIADRDESLSCNDLVKIAGGENYYFDVSLQPQIYLDIYGVDDPSVELHSFYINDELIEIKPNVSFQTRQKIDISSFKGEITLKTLSRSPTDVVMGIPYDYNRSDEIEYTIKY